MSIQVFLLDPSEKFNKEVSTFLEGVDFQVNGFTSTDAILESIKIQSPDILVSDAQLYLHSPAFSKITGRLPDVFYSDDLPETQQMQIIKKGRGRLVLSSQKNLARDVAAAIRMTTHRRYDIRSKRQLALTHGDMGSLALGKLLHNALIEQKNLILKVRRGSWEARLRTHLGHIVSAQTSHLSGVDALLKILHLKTGKFILRGYESQGDSTVMNTSTLGILAEKQYEMLALQTYLNQYFHGKRNERLFADQSLPDGQLTGEQQQLKTLVEEYGKIDALFLYSPFTFLKTLRIIESMTADGIIRTKTSAALGSTMSKSDRAAVTVAEPLDGKRKSSGISKNGPNGKTIHLKDQTIVVLGENCRTDLMTTIANSFEAPLKTSKTIDFTRINHPPGQTVNILGISIQEAFLEAIERIAQQLIGCLVLVDYQKPAQWEFLGYLQAQIEQLYDVPIVFAVVNQPDDAGVNLTFLRQQLDLDSLQQLVVIDSSKTEDPRSILQHFVNTDKDVEANTAINSENKKHV